MKKNELSLGWLPLDEWGFISISGKDRLSFVQALISNDVIELKKNKIIRAALLEKNSQIIAPFWVSKASDHLLLFAQKTYLLKIKEKFEQFIFSEEVKLSQEDKSLVYLHGAKLPETFPDLNWGGYTANALIDDVSSEEIERLHTISFTPDEGVIIVAKKKSPQVPKSLQTFLLKNDVPKIEKNTWEAIRVGAGLGIMGLDFDEKNMLLEIDVGDEMISRSKGCYPGQETVARTLSRGSVKKKLFGLKHRDSNLSLGDSLYFKGKKVADIKSTAYSPTVGMHLSLAFLKKNTGLLAESIVWKKYPGTLNLAFQ